MRIILALLKAEPLGHTWNEIDHFWGCLNRVFCCRPVEAAAAQQQLAERKDRLEQDLVGYIGKDRFTGSGLGTRPQQKSMHDLIPRTMLGTVGHRAVNCRQSFQVTLIHHSCLIQSIVLIVLGTGQPSDLLPVAWAKAFRSSKGWLQTAMQSVAN